EVEDLTPIDGVRAIVMGASYKKPNKLLVGINDRDPRWHDVYEVDIVSGERTLRLQNDGFSRVFSDLGLEIVAALRAPTESAGSRRLRGTRKGEWEKVAEWGVEDDWSTRPLTVDPSGRTLYMLDSRGRDTSALVALNLQTGKARVLGQSERVD